MILVLLFLIGAVLLGFMLQRAPFGALTTGQRLYLWLTPVPILLDFLMPALPLLGGGAPWPRSVINRLSMAGLALSGGLFLIGAWLVWRRRSLGQAPDNRMVAGMILAAIPALLAGLVALMYAFLG